MTALTCHRLVHCQPAQLVEHVARLPEVKVSKPAEITPRWFPRAVPRGGAIIGWRQRCPGTGELLRCLLEVEPAATGVLAHLSTAPATGRSWPRPAVVSTILLKIWTARLLAEVATAVEADLRSARRSKSF